MMKPAEYPQKRCREAVWSAGGLAYSCELPLMHTGPCASQSAQNSVQARERWEEANPNEVGGSVDGGDVIL